MGDSLEEMINKPSKLGRVWKAVKRYTVAPLVLATGFYAMGCGGGNNNGENHAPNAISQSSLMPANNFSYDVGDVLTVGFDCPADPDGDALTGRVVVTGDTDGVPGKSAGDFTRTINLGTLQAGANYSEDVDTSGFEADAAGTTYTVDIFVSDGKAEVSATRTGTLFGEAENTAPVAAFNYAPQNPKVDEEITFTSTSTDADDDALTCSWDLDGDGQFDDSNDCTANWTFDTAGDHDVSLKVTDGEDEDTMSQTVSVEEDINPVRVTGCYVRGSNVGVSIAIDCYCSDTAESFSLTGGPESARIFNDGGIITSRIMEASDVGLHTYIVTCTAGGITSDPYEFTVPVDILEGRVTVRCQGSANATEFLLPETSVDVVAEQCVAGYTPALKPAANGDPDYIGDADPTCIKGAINSLPAAEKEAHKNYNSGNTISDLDCTFDFAQVKYHHD